MKCLVVLMIPLLVFAGSVTKTFTFSPYEITSSKVNGYDFIYLGNELYTSEPGSPSLPELSYSLLVPPTAEVTGIEVISYKVKDIPGAFNIFPAQPARPLSQIHNGTPFTAPNPAVYTSRSAYPGRLAAFVPTGCMSGYRIAGVMLYPVQYIPAEQKLKLYTELTVKLTYEEGRHELVTLSKGQVELFGSDVSNLVANPEMIEPWGPGVKPLLRDSCDYLIITPNAYVANYQPIVNWRSKKGYYVHIVPTETVYVRYTGRDNAEKVRNCIRDYWQTKGTKWVLLGGDITLVPYRTCYVNSNGTIDNIPTDLYFADMQWSYDGNRNNIFGECPFNGDTVDLYCDLYVGRNPIDNATHANTFVLKDTVYEKRPNPTYMVRLFLPQGNLWSTWRGDSVQQMISRLPSVPPWVIRKMYETQGQLSRTACTETLRTGVGFAHLVGHGDASGVYMGYGTSLYSGRSDVSGLTNAGRYIISNSIACHAGQFDSDCYAEDFVNAANGGAVAAMYNSRYGWGYSSGPVGLSEELDRIFYDYFFNRDSLFEVGKCHTLSKHVYRGSAMNQPVWRWIYYELNLFGDPALAMWERTPLTLTVTHAGSIPRGAQNFTVTVNSGGSPLANALVCLWKGDEVYAKAKTNASGQVTLAINPVTNGAMSVTASAKDHYPYESAATVGVAEEKVAVPLARSIGLVSNPVHGRLVISYTLPNRELVNIRLFDATGRQVGTVARGQYQGAGQIVYRPTDLASGVYFVQFETAAGTQTQSVLIVK